MTHRCILRTYAGISNDFGSSNSGLFAHMTKQDNILYFTYKHTHIFPILILVFHAGLFAHVSKYLEACILRVYGHILYGFWSFNAVLFAHIAYVLV